MIATKWLFQWPRNPPPTAGRQARERNVVCGPTCARSRGGRCSPWRGARLCRFASGPYWGLRYWGIGGTDGWGELTFVGSGWAALPCVSELAAASVMAHWVALARALRGGAVDHHRQRRVAAHDRTDRSRTGGKGTAGAVGHHLEVEDARIDRAARTFGCACGDLVCALRTHARHTGGWHGGVVGRRHGR
jgi:hypothetical protein